MSANLNKLLEGVEDVIFGTPVSSAAVRLCRRNLTEKGFPPLPERYWQILSAYNGIFYDNAELYGLDAHNKLIHDLCEVNLSADWSDEANALLLGENSEDFLIYDGDNEEFKVIDKQDETVWRRSDDIDTAAAFLLGI